MAPPEHSVDLIPIHVRLLDEGTECSRPTQAERLESGLFVILPTPDYNAEDEHWEFPPGSIVRAVIVAGKEYLLAARP